MVSPMSDPARHPDDSGPADAAKRHCRNCGAVPGSRYCGECGEPTYRGPLTAAQLAARPRSLSWRRRRRTSSVPARRTWC
jgi:hypothetical protein